MSNSKIKNVIRNIVPTVLNSVCFFLFSAVDAIFISRGVGIDALGAMGLIRPFILIFGSINMLVSIGGISVFAVRLGRGDEEGANKVFRYGMALMLFVSTIFCIIGVFFTAPICKMLGADETYLGFAVDYVFWYSVFIIPFALSTALQGYCRNDNDPHLVSIVVIVTTLCNVFGDWLLIYPIQWGMKGAAIATGISQTIGFFIILTHFIRRKGIIRFKKIKLDSDLFSDIKEIVVRGLPEGIGQLATPVMTFCMNIVLINKAGALGVNAFSVISSIAGLAMAGFFGASEGLQPLFGQSYGAKNEQDLKYYFKTGIKISFFGSAAITILVILFGKQLSILFGADSATQEYILKVLPQYAIGFVIMALNVMISSYLYSTERSLLASIISALRSVIVNAAIILILPHIFGESIIWFSLLIYEAFVLVIAVTLLRHSERNGIHFKE